MASAWRNGNSSLAATELIHKNDRAYNPQQSNRFITVLHIENLAKSGKTTLSACWGNVDKTMQLMTSDCIPELVP